MGTTLATYYAKLQDMPDSEYKVEILEDGPIKKIAVNGKIYEVDYNMGGDSIHSIIIDHHSHGVQISPSSNNSYTIMNKGELYQIELQGEMEKIHNARTAAESVGRQVVQAPMPDGASCISTSRMSSGSTIFFLALRQISRYRC